jgi:hypothetical protein
MPTGRASSMSSMLAPKVLPLGMIFMPSLAD